MFEMPYLLRHWLNISLLFACGQAVILVGRTPQIQLPLCSMPNAMVPMVHYVRILLFVISSDLIEYDCSIHLHLNITILLDIGDCVSEEIETNTEEIFTGRKLIQLLRISDNNKTKIQQYKEIDRTYFLLRQEIGIFLLYRAVADYICRPCPTLPAHAYTKLAHYLWEAARSFQEYRQTVRLSAVSNL